MSWWTPQLAAIAWGMFQALVILLGAVLLGAVTVSYTHLTLPTSELV